MSVIQKSESSAQPRVGDLVRFRDHHQRGPRGIVLGLKTFAAPHSSQPERRTAYIEWACPYTPRGNYQVYLLEVISESR